MSGYLSRMAASVIRPQPRVHPFVESRFAAARKDTPPELTVRVEAPVGAEQRAEGSVQTLHIETRVERAQTILHGESQAASEGMAIPQAAERVQSRRPEAARETTATEREVFRPLLTPRAVSQAETRVPHSPRTQKPESADEGIATAAGAALQADGSQRVEVKERTYEPLVAPAVAPARVASFAAESAPPNAQAKRESPLIATNAATRSAPQMSMTPRAAGQRSVSMASPDIQIHIGRIEVIAVPPAAQPLAAPPRRGPTLDEYLSGGNGRTR